MLHQRDVTILDVKSQANMFSNALICMHFPPFRCDFIDCLRKQRELSSEQTENSVDLPRGLVL